MQQQTRFCKTPDGVRIAYATSGSGPPLVKAANWMSHLEFGWSTPIWRHWAEALSLNHTLIRYDQRGLGLSDWDVDDVSFEACFQDLETVIDAAGLDRFSILGVSQGGQLAIEYAFRYPERVTHLVVFGTYAQGIARSGASAEQIEAWNAMVTLTRHGWGRDNPAYRQIWTQRFIPDGTAAQMDWFDELQRLSASSDNAARFLENFAQADISGRLAQIRVPTLVMHCDEDAVVPFKLGRNVATRVPGARFVPIRSRNHLLLEDEPGWKTFLDEMRSFLGIPTEETSIVARLQTALDNRPMASGAIGKYEVLEKIGEGGMGQVLLAHDTALERKVALKLLPDDLRRDPIAQQRLFREARLAAALDHPFICKIYEIGEAGDWPFIAMEYIEGTSLEAELANGPLSLKRGLAVAGEIAEALQLAHRQDLVHRDLKPANIQLTAHGHVKVMDFGIAKRVDASEPQNLMTKLTQSGTVIGTPAYMSPEQLRGSKVDTRSDTFSFGVLLQEMLTGAHPFKRATFMDTASAILNESAAALVLPLEEVPDKLQSAVTAMLEKDPSQRPGSIDELRPVLALRFD